MHISTLKTPSGRFKPNRLKNAMISYNPAVTVAACLAYHLGGNDVAVAYRRGEVIHHCRKMRTRALTIAEDELSSVDLVDGHGRVRTGGR